MVCPAPTWGPQALNLQDEESEGHSPTPDTVVLKSSSADLKSTELLYHRGVRQNHRAEFPSVESCEGGGGIRCEFAQIVVRGEATGKT